MSRQKLSCFVFPLLLGMVLLLSACGYNTPTPQPTIYNPGCSVPTLLANLNTANQNSEPAIINLEAGCEYSLTQVYDTATISGSTVQNGLPRITKTITINGNNATIDIQGPNMGHFFIEPNGDLALYDLTLSNGARPIGGAVINLQGDFFASRTTFLNNVAYPDGDSVAGGGAIYNNSGRVRIIDNSRFQDNHAGETLTTGYNLGGAIFNINGLLLVTDSVFENNHAAGQGGAIYSIKNASDESGGMITINDVEFFDNYAIDKGGALFVRNENNGVYIVRTDFNYNQTDNSGGAIFAEGSNVEGIENLFFNNRATYGAAVYTKYSEEGFESTYNSFRTTFWQNIAYEMGGAIFSEGSDLSVDESTLKVNWANNCGAIISGGTTTINTTTGEYEIPSIASTIRIIDSDFNNNQASGGSGGGICHISGDLMVENSTFFENQASQDGGGIIIHDNAVLIGAKFINNTADIGGGGLSIGLESYLSLGYTIPIGTNFITTISGSNFSANSAGNAGGGIKHVAFGVVEIAKTDFIYNTAISAGGAISVYSGDMDIQNSTFSGNSSKRGGGIKSRQVGVNNYTLDIKHSTFAYNVATEIDNEENPYHNLWGGGALNVSESINLENNLFAYNTSIDCQLENGMNYSGSGNYSTDGTCGGTVETNPLIGPLKDNGGGTQTHALLSGSPLIDVLSGCAGMLDDQRGITRQQGSGCDPGSYEFDPNEIPLPPHIPQTPQGSTDSSDRCDPFAGMEVSLYTLGLPKDTLQLPVVLRVIGGEIPGLNPESMNGFPLYEYSAQLGDFQSNKCGLQGFPDRLFCMFQMLPGSPGLALDFKLKLEGCEDPVYSQPMLSIPEPQSGDVPGDPGLVCTKDLKTPECEAAGGEMSKSIQVGPVCICPDGQ
jgi:predicted outer membrane repeat protein